MSRILVRFNTKHELDAGHRKWRVVIDGQEHLADHVKINIPCETIMEEVESHEKHHFLCHGVVKWDGTVASIENA
jgi:hypothetical protein